MTFGGHHMGWGRVSTFAFLLAVLGTARPGAASGGHGLGGNLGAGAAAPDSDAILGAWQTEPEDDGQWARVEIAHCGQRYCGDIVFLSQPLVTVAEDSEDAGRVKLDVNNPDEALRDRPILGLRLMTEFRYDDGKWKDGRIYDPKSGKTYRCEMELDENGQVLKVRGFIKIAFIKVGRTTEWTRYAPPDSTG